MRQRTSELPFPPPDSLKGEASAYDLFRVYRSYIEHENGLIDQRVKSGLSIHAFLFTLYGLTLTKAIGTGAPRSRPIRPGSAADVFSSAEHHLNLWISVFGMAAAVITFLSISAAVMAIRRLARNWSMIIGPRGPEFRLPAPTGAGHGLAGFLGFSTTLALPALILAAWFCVLLYSTTLPAGS